MDPDLRARLTAFARDCVTHGDMTPSGEVALLSILDRYPDMELESHPIVPVSVLDFNDDGSPMMREDMFPLRRHFEWAQELSDRLEAERNVQP